MRGELLTEAAAMSAHSSSVDVRALVALVEDGRSDSRGQCLPQATLEGLLALVGADSIAVIEMDARSSRPSRQQQLGLDGPRETDEALADDHPFPRYFPAWGIPEYGRRTGDIATPLRWSDFYSLRELPNQPLWAEFFRFTGHLRGLSLSLPALYPLERRLVLWRGRGPDFTDRDVSLLALLRPHLHDLGCQVQHRRAPTALSPRQRQVISLAAQGMTNTEIATALFLSVGTVRKHLENAYTRTGTHSRAEAALAVPATALVVTGSAPRRTRRSLPRST